MFCNCSKKNTGSSGWKVKKDKCGNRASALVLVLVLLVCLFYLTAQLTTGRAF